MRFFILIWFSLAQVAIAATASVDISADYAADVEVSAEHCADHIDAGDDLHEDCGADCQQCASCAPGVTGFAEELRSSLDAANAPVTRGAAPPGAISQPLRPPSRA